MSLSCGIVGLPNVGKSTIFNALTSAKAEVANYPFCTINPNTGIVKVPDKRLNDICDFVKPKQVVPAAMTFVDIAGLVKGASKGEGLGNQFLAHIRETDAIAHVVRCFEDSNITHVEGSVDPIRDIQVIDIELMLADLETVIKRFSSIEKAARAGADKKVTAVYGVLAPIRAALDSGKPVRSLNLSPEELALVQDFHLLTEKKVMYIANLGDGDSSDPSKNPLLKKVVDHAKAEGSMVVPVCGKIESEIAELPDGEKAEFLKEMHMDEPGLDRVIRTGYNLLGLQTYFTAGEKEVRAWTFHKGWKAPRCAGVIHTDFERGFIRAEVYHYGDLMKYKSEQAIRDAGSMRVEGKEYVVADGDIMHFRFNV